MEKKEFSTPDQPFALGVICVCTAGLGYQLFLLLPVLVVCRFINRKFLFFTLCGIAAGVFSLAFHLHLKQERLEQLIAGLKKGKIFDSTVLVVSLVVIAIPVFVLGFLLQFIVGVKLQWASPTAGGDAGWSDLILPAVVLGLASFAYVLRLTRTSVIENMNADYVRTATAKGLSRPRVVTVHILRNSLIPVVTFLGADLGALMGGAIVTEGIFNVPGVGQRLYQSIVRGEGATIVSIVSVLVLVYVVANLLVDLLYAWLDPRIRYE